MAFSHVMVSAGPERDDSGVSRGRDRWLRAASVEEFADETTDEPREGYPLFLCRGPQGTKLIRLKVDHRPRFHDSDF